jgi:acyl-coenzyme A thioesterase PaaI-like protein
MTTEKYSPPDFSDEHPGEGHTEIIAPFSTKSGKSFIGGDQDCYRLRLQMYLRDADHHLVSKVWFGPEAQGPPGHAHGGSMAAVLDHTMGIAAWVTGTPVVAAQITINFVRGLPLGSTCTVETWVDKVDGKKVYTRGMIYLEASEKPYSTGEGLFIIQDLERFRGLVADEEPLGENAQRLHDFVNKGEE